MGSNTHGFDNEKKICRELKGDLENLKPDLKNFVKYIAEKNNLTVSGSTQVDSTHITDNLCKSDLKVNLDGENFGVSAKSGSANSVHQEDIEDFTKFIIESDRVKGVSNEIVEYFEWFIKSENSAKKLKKKHPYRVEELQNFVDDNKRVLAERFVKTGLVDYHHVDFIYYGTPEEGSWAEVGEAIDKAISRSNSGANLPVGSLTIQAWARSNEERSEDLQVKWGRIEKDLDEVRNCRNQYSLNYYKKNSRG